MVFSPILRVALASALVLLMCTGCGGESSQTCDPALGVCPNSGAGSRAQGPGPAVTARPTSLFGIPSGVDHGAPQEFWPHPQWSPPPVADPAPRAPVVAADSRSGPFGIPDAATVPTPEPRPDRPEPATSTSGGTLLKTGTASWYGPGFHGRKTANGETYDQNAMTAAMTGVPLGITVRVECTDSSKCSGSIVVRVNDRGPYQRENGKWVPHATRVIDLSKEAMERIGGVRAGIVPVKVYRID